VATTDQRRIPPSPATTFQNDYLLAGFDEIGQDQARLIMYQGSQRHGEHQILAPPAGAQITLAVGSRLRGVVRVPFIGQQGCHRWVGLQYDVPTGSAGTADGPPFWLPS
jgi:hypothetical protein